MRELTRGQIIKTLECCEQHGNCQECPINGTGIKGCMFNAMHEALELIKELIDEIKFQEEQYDRVYEQAEADIHGNIADGGTSCHWCMDKTKADTVQRMQIMLNQRIDRTLDVFDFNISECNAIRQALRGVKNDIDQIAKELLEGKNDV